MRPGAQGEAGRELEIGFGVAAMALLVEMQAVALEGNGARIPPRARFWSSVQYSTWMESQSWRRAPSTIARRWMMRWRAASSVAQESPPAGAMTTR